jgi:hypothetical protein
MESTILLLFINGEIYIEKYENPELGLNSYITLD